MLTLQIHPVTPEPRKIAQAVKVLEDGGVALYPTDTVYALGCAIEVRRAVERIRRLKNAPEEQPLALLCSDLREAARYAVVNDFAHRTMRRLVPGPYTFVLEATRELPKVLAGKQRTVGVRIPENPICLAIISALGRPLLTSSAVPPDEDEAVHDVEEASKIWGKQLDLLIDGGPTPGQVSTVVSLVDDRVEILRAGLGVDELENEGSA